jgi:ribosome-binding protein aMBF1 (putative translation factor)
MTTTFKQFKVKALKNQAVKSEYSALGPEYALIKTIINHRLKRGWSQTELAEAIGSRQPVISRLERGEGNPSLQTLQRIAQALDLSLHVSMK